MIGSLFVSCRTPPGFTLFPYTTLFRASLGVASLEEAVGHVECLRRDPSVRTWKSQGIDLDAILRKPGPTPGTVLHHTQAQDHELDKSLDVDLINQAVAALHEDRPVAIKTTERNVNRSVGTM